MFHGRPRKQTRRIQSGQRAIIRSDQKGNLGAAENYAVTALVSETSDYVVVSKSGTLGKGSVHEFVPDRVVDNPLIIRCWRKYIDSDTAEGIAIRRTGHRESSSK